MLYLGNGVIEHYVYCTCDKNYSFTKTGERKKEKVKFFQLKKPKF